MNTKHAGKPGFASNALLSDDFQNECQNVPPVQPPIDLRRDDIVNVREDDGTSTIQTVKYKPWQLGDGTWVVGLFGRRGGFLLDRVTLNRRGRV